MAGLLKYSPYNSSGEKYVYYEYVKITYIKKQYIGLIIYLVNSMLMEITQNDK